MFEGGEIGADPFRAACEMVPEGLVSKHRDRLYQGRQVEALDQFRIGGLALILWLDFIGT